MPPYVIETDKMKIKAVNADWRLLKPKSIVIPSIR
jgi:hypothetical protein